MTDQPQIDPYKSLAAFFAYELRRAREAEGLSQSELAADILTTRACVSAYENCTRRPGREFARDADERLGIEDRLQIIQYHSRREHGSSWLAEYLEQEPRAHAIKVYQSQVVPGLLQTRAYVSALLAVGNPEDLERSVTARLARQTVLTREEPAPPEVLVLLDQAVLLRMIGGLEVMRAQLIHLLSMGELPNVTIQIVPFSAGANWGTMGEFLILGLLDGDVAYAEAQMGGRLIQDPADVRELGVRYDRIRAKALSEDASRDLIAETVRTLR